MQNVSLDLESYQFALPTVTLASRDCLVRLETKNKLPTLWPGL